MRSGYVYEHRGIKVIPLYIEKAVKDYVYKAGDEIIEAKDIDVIYDELGKKYYVKKKLKSVKYSADLSTFRTTLIVSLPFGEVEVTPHHSFYIEYKEKMTLEDVCAKWGAYFLEENDNVNMKISEHKQFAKDCEKAGITALDVYEYMEV